MAIRLNLDIHELHYCRYSEMPIGTIFVIDMADPTILYLKIGEYAARKLNTQLDQITDLSWSICRVVKYPPHDDIVEAL